VIYINGLLAKELGGVGIFIKTIEKDILKYKYTLLPSNKQQSRISSNTHKA